MWLVLVQGDPSDDKDRGVLDEQATEEKQRTEDDGEEEDSQKSENEDDEVSILENIVAVECSSMSSCVILGTEADSVH